MRTVLPCLKVIGVLLAGAAAVQAQSGGALRPVEVVTVARGEGTTHHAVDMASLLPPPTPEAEGPRTSSANGGLTIVPTFDASVDAATQTAINSALTYYQNNISTNLTVNIHFRVMNSGLGQSTFFSLFGTLFQFPGEFRVLSQWRR
jgi:hypothetical protein